MMMMMMIMITTIIMTLFLYIFPPTNPKAWFSSESHVCKLYSIWKHHYCYYKIVYTTDCEFLHHPSPNRQRSTPSLSRTSIKRPLKRIMEYEYLVTRLSRIVLNAQSVFVRMSIHSQICQWNQKREIWQKIHSKRQPTKFLPVRKQVMLKCRTTILQVSKKSLKSCKSWPGQKMRRWNCSSAPCWMVLMFNPAM